MARKKKKKSAQRTTKQSASRKRIPTNKQSASKSTKADSQQRAKTNKKRKTKTVRSRAAKAKTAVRSRRSGKRTLADRLSRLTYIGACQLLGERGKELIQQGSRYDSIDVERDVFLGKDLFRLRLPDYSENGSPPVVTITLIAAARNRLHFNCTACKQTCEHVGAAFSLILEEKSLLGLAEPPPEEIPFELLDEPRLVQLALSERETRAQTEKFRMKSTDSSQPWTDYVVTSAGSGKSYRVALRGEQRGISYCSCPDFRTNTLGTCKHIMYVLGRVKSKFSAKQRAKTPRRERFSVHVRYDDHGQLQLSPPSVVPDDAKKVASKFLGQPTEDGAALVSTIAQLERAGHEVIVYPDAEQTIQHKLFQQHISDLVREIRRDPSGHPLRKSLLKTELLPYQLDGIAFAVGAGRAILADDMGLGKTIQGIGVAELLAQEAGIAKVLVICPTSLKSQWRNEVQRFSGRPVQLVLGSADQRAMQYDNDAFMTVCNYEQVLRDILAIERVPWDLIILDEAQRIKNWEAKTSNVVKSLRSRFALVLTGTPLENRLDELYSVVQFVDDRRLGPGFRFFNRHRVVDDGGKVLGYKNLDELRQRLQPILLRRTRDKVLDQLPPRTTDIVRIAPSDEQAMLHRTHMKIVAHISRKAYLTEMDVLRLQQALLMCRMAANCTYLVDKQEPWYSTKLEHLAGLIERIAAEPSRKCVLFSEWTRMLNLIEPLLEQFGVDFVRLDGSVPQKKRQALVNQFQTEADCRFFITTNAGSTGLNLQAANTVINVDLPWNPAVLEQRIARAHRMGQREPVHVYVLVTEETLEENLLGVLSSKHDLALAALDFQSDVAQVDFVSNVEEMRRRLEVLLGAPSHAPTDESSLARVEEDVDRLSKQRRERVAAAGGELLGAVFGFLGELTAADDSTSRPDPEFVNSLKDSLGQCVSEDEAGRPQLNLTLPDRSALDRLAETMARLLVPPQQ